MSILSLIPSFRFSDTKNSRLRCRPFSEKYLFHTSCFSSQFEAIPESLKNMLLVMSTAGIFDEEECTLTAHSQSTDDRKTHKRTDSEIHKYSALWQVTWERIDCFLPNLRQELFTPRSQSPAANIVQVKTEPEKVTAEEPRPAAPELPGMPVEGTIPYFTVLE